MRVCDIYALVTWASDTVSGMPSPLHQTVIFEIGKCTLDVYATLQAR